ncbi:MAG: vWA domain-containing protein [Gammaproteobacteria bacterium]
MPGRARDFISIDPVGADDRTYGNYAYTSRGNPLSLRVPDDPGDYLVRYHLAQSYRVLGERPLTVVSATAKITPPAEAETRSVIEIGWEGPDNEGDFITIVQSGAPERQYGHSNGYTARGNPVRVEAPEKPGQYEVRYLTGQKYLTLASAPLAVVPGKTPGLLRVVGDTGATAGAGPGAVELVLDASGSMLQRIDGVPRIQIARDALVELTQNVLSAGTPFALRVFGHREADSCRTDLEIALAPLDPAAAVARIRSIEAKNLAKTPIGASLLAVREDLAGADGPAVVVLVTDGEETCEGDPKAAIATLRESGIDARVNIVGFAIDEVVLKETFEEWARVGQGTYFDARDGEELNEAMRASLRVPFQVLRDGAVVASGAVNGEAVELAAGDYEVRVLTDPPRSAGPVSIASGDERELDIDAGN